MENKESITVKKLRLYAMMMRVVEIQEELRPKVIILVDKPEVKPLILEAPIHMGYEPTILQSELDYLPQKIKHRKKRKYHN